ncbi:MAG: M14 family metallocarboxypeptidase [Actinomycetota bacterium]|nr:M14 family metallocarboxypeptidase [Actinomycetota bacterium]MDQ5807077.1 M14 family metallocarboxypeptidase [Actinomycetota bacterium]
MAHKHPLRSSLLALAAALAAAAPAAAAPVTGFEQRNGASWTTHEEEVAFLEAVERGSRRVKVDRIGMTAEGRPLHLVRLGDKPPKQRDALREPTVLFVCSQHGNEPAGREACLKLLRDLAFAEDPATLELLATRSFLFVPAANPDGREANTRGNSDGVDVNRDHLNLTTPEARAMAKVVRDWKPEVALDLHEYGPSIPGVYDDEVLYLWPRNLNIDDGVHDLAEELGRGYILPDSEKAGYSADEYGQYELADNDIHQSAGDGDEGIMRNAMGLRHSLGVLVETAVTADPRNSPLELVDEAMVQRRRVDAHMNVTASVLRFIRERGAEAQGVTTGAAVRKAREGRERSAPVYFGGADNQEPAPEDVVDPPPCGYRLTAEQVAEHRTVLQLLGIRSRKSGGGAFVPIGQAAEPVIPLLLDARGTRHSAEAEPVTDC